MDNHACFLTLDGSHDTAGGETGGQEGCPNYKYKEMTGYFISRNGGWMREGINLYNKLY